MMKKLVILGAFLLAACGVDGEPVQPTGGVNVSLSPSGVGLGANVGLKKGPLRIGLGL
ncbi:hypothetical protein DSW25_05735 [Sulfitobacter donghicola DSW-25 = KCTC 12864 = JCM 14565]|uniref:Argininosuccinate lyase n=2 Tax=Sulfitobacter TaxID=60136 RepID=A0A073IIY2_9RHOB|nr:hypothetical protein DSW25_05735 [Sulfitobacter donghicola DSW-25 = KCTC 12864 = JCM 14565]